MTVDLAALHAQCVRFGVTPHMTETVVSAHALLARLPQAVYCGRYRLTPRVESLGGEEWCAWLGQRSLHVGSLEECVTALAQRCSP